MARSRKTQPLKAEIQGQSFDLVLDFNGSLNPQLFVDEDTAYLIQQLLQAHKHFILRINWWNPDLRLELPDAPTTSQERLRELMEPYLSIDVGRDNKSA